MHPQSRFPPDLAALGIALGVALLAAPAMAQSGAHAGHPTQAHAGATAPHCMHQGKPPCPHHPAQAAPAPSSEAHAHPAATVAPQPAAPRWPTDAPLRRGMRDIRQAVTALEHVQHGHIDATQAPAFADQIQAAVNGMIANCKLAPEADAELHGLLVKFIAGANAARNGPVTLELLKPMQEALAVYPTRFDDPGWNTAPGD